METKPKKRWSKTLLSFFVFLTLLVCPAMKRNKMTVPKKSITLSTVPDFMSMEPQEGLYQALEYYHIPHPDIVWCIAYLETGNFTSENGMRFNNLFGIYDSKNHRYRSYNHWIESVEDFKKSISYRYRPGEGFYHFLKRIRYASDPDYITKLKQIHEQFF